MGIKGLTALISDEAPGAIKEHDIKVRAAGVSDLLCVVFELTLSFLPLLSSK
jgi:hypothetical protein